MNPCIIYAYPKNHFTGRKEMGSLCWVPDSKFGRRANRWFWPRLYQTKSGIDTQFLPNLQGCKIINSANHIPTIYLNSNPATIFHSLFSYPINRPPHAATIGTKSPNPPRRRGLAVDSVPGRPTDWFMAKVNLEYVIFVIQFVIPKSPDYFIPMWIGR